MAEGDAVAYNNLKEQLLLGALDFSADTFKVILLSNAYTFSKDGSPGYSSVSANEIVASGYSAGGATLSGLSVTQDDANDWAKFDATVDTTWSSLGTATIEHAVLYDDTITTPVADPLLIHWEIATNSNGGDYTLQYHTNGLLLLS